MNEEQKEKQEEVQEKPEVETQEATLNKDEVKTEKTYTQEEYQSGIDKAIANRFKDYPSKEELEEYKEWKKTQKKVQEEQKQQEKNEKEEEFNKKINNLQNENKILKKGINSKYADYVLFSVSKMEGEFDDNLETFIKENEELLKGKPITTGIRTESSDKSEISGAKALIRERNPEQFKK